jgi:hypothetical protein
MIYRLSGRQSTVADPDRYLARWREHGPLAAAIEALSSALVEPIRRAPASLRPALAATVERDSVQVRLEAAVDRAIGRRDAAPPSSVAWPILGVLQTLATAAIIASVAWVVVWILARPPVDSVVLPGLGPVPVPFLALLASLAGGYVLARVLGLHAGWVGRRAARRLKADITAAVEQELSEHAFERLDRLEDARRALASTTRHSRRDPGLAR